MAEGIFDNWRSRENRQHTLIASHPQSVFSRWAGDEDTNEAERLCMDPTVRTGWWWWESKVATGGFQEPDRAFRDRSAYRSVSRQRPCDLSGKWVDRVQERNPIGELILDLDRLSVRPVVLRKDGLQRTLWRHLLPSVLTSSAILIEQALLHQGQVHSADDWHSVLKPVVARYRGRISTASSVVRLRWPIPTSTLSSKRKTTGLQFVDLLTRTYSTPLSLC